MDKVSTPWTPFLQVNHAFDDFPPLRESPRCLKRSGWFYLSVWRFIFA